MSSASLRAAYSLPDALAVDPTGSCEPLRGWPLLVTRAGWLAAVLSTVALFVVGLPFRQAELAATLHGLSPAQDLVLRELGVSAQQQARLVLLVEAAVPALFLAIALLVFRRRSDDWMAIFVSAGLVTYIAWVSPVLTALAAAETAWRLPATLVQATGMTFAVAFFLIFPDGRFVPRWTRAFLAIAVAWAVAWVLLPTSPFDLSDVYRLPLPAFVAVASCWVVGIGAQLYRFSRVSSQIQRQQTKWVVSATFVGIAAYLIFGFNRFVVPLVAGPLLPQVVYDLIGVPLFLVVLLVIPAAFAVSVLRYRLWDIDLIINRALVYGTLAAIVGGTFPTTIAVSQRLSVAFAGETSDAAIVLAVVVVGSIFTSAKGRLQALVDRHLKVRKSTPRELRRLFVVPWRSKTARAAFARYLLVAVAVAGAWAVSWLFAPEWSAAKLAGVGPLVLAGFGGVLLLLYAASGRYDGPERGLAGRRHPGEGPGARASAPGRSRSAPPSTPSLDLRGERKRVTVMFADLSGFTAMAENADPEEVRALVNSCFEQMVPAITEYGGTVNKFLGDGIVALFGAPIAHENDPERALRAALRMQDVLAAFNAERGARLQMHFGVNTGLVVVGGVGSSEQHDYTVIGDAANLAARLEESSAAGEILVGPETYRSTSREFEFQPVGNLNLKGRSELVTVHRLLRARERAKASRGVGSQEVGSPLVGRDRELALAKQHMEQLRAGHGGVVFIVGEAGIGKSRLVAELRQVGDGLGFSWLEGGATLPGQHISYRPFVDIIQAELGIAADDDQDDRWRKLEERASALFPGEAQGLLPYLAALLSIDMPADRSDRLRHLDGEAMGRQLFRAARRFFAGLAEERPLTLVFEDIHLLDESSVHLLEHLLPLCREVPLLFILVGHPEPNALVAQLRRTAELSCGDRCAELPLSPLSPSDTARLAGNLVQEDELPSGLREIVLSKAGGNPLFVEELIRALVDQGGLKRTRATGRWQATADLELMAVPDTLAGIVAARIDRMSDEAKEVLKLAAVIGDRFSYEVLRGVADAGQELDRGLQELEARDLVKEKRHPELEYAFKHTLIREVAYESILLRRRQELHRRVAESMEAEFAGRIDDFYGLLAYHYTQAECWTNAQEYLLKAGDQAGKLAADAEALSHYEQALAAYGHAFGDGWDPMERAVLDGNVGVALFRRGEHGQGRKHLERALASLGEPYPTSRWGVRSALVREMARQAVHRILPGLFVRPATLRVDRALAELSHQYETIKWMDFFLDGERSMLSTLLLLNQAERSGYAVGMVKASSALGISLDAVGLKKLGGYYCRRAAALADEAGEAQLIGDAYTLLGIHEEYFMGNVAIAPEYLDRGARGHWESGSIKGWAAATTLAGRSMARRGDFAGALELFRHVGRVAEDAAERQAQGWGLSFEGEMLEVAGAFEEASSRLLRAVELFRAVPDYMSLALAQGLLGRCYMRWGRLSEAQQLLEEARRSVLERGLRGFMSSPVWLSLAEVDLAVAEQARGRAREAALARAQRSCQAALGQSQVDVLASASAFRIRGSLEHALGRTDEAIRWWQRSLQEAEVRGMRYELGLTHLEIGTRTGDSSHLERAESLLAGTRAEFDLAQAREQLRFASPSEVMRPSGATGELGWLPRALRG
jgi:class 3 adenylate cyclase/tetratricopeptide (TPR) repeat protein